MILEWNYMVDLKGMAMIESLLKHNYDDVTKWGNPVSTVITEVPLS